VKRLITLALFCLHINAAVLYVRSTDGNDSDDGSTWSLAKATLAAALTAAGAGDTIYVSDNHAESTAAAVALTSAGTGPSPVSIFCADDAAEPPTALATTCAVSTTGSNSHITFSGYGSIYGITFTAGSSSLAASINFTSASPWAWTVVDSKLAIGNTAGTSLITLGVTTGADDQQLTMINTPVSFAAVGQYINSRSLRLDWRNTPNAVQGTMPTILLKPAAAASLIARLSGLDLSAMGSGKSLFDGSVATTGTSDVRIVNCKINAAVTVMTGTLTGPGGATLLLVNSDGADTNYRMAHYKFAGSIESETTVVRTGGASDGTTALAWKMISLTSGPSRYFPLASPVIAQWNDTTGSSKTATVEIVHDSVTALTDQDVWLECEYLSTSGFPQSSVASDADATPLTAGTNQTSSSETWGGSLTNPNEQALAVTFTPQEKGPVLCRVMLAKPNYTIYVDPKITIQ
jgi:hypothetical protein